MTNPIPSPIPNRQQPIANNQPPVPDPRHRANRANALLSTGPRTAAGKQRSSLNAVSHGLTAASPVLPSEDPAAYQHHCRQFSDEYKPATPTESQLTQELADTAWRLNRIPLLEAELLSQNPNPQTLIPQLASLGMHSQRLSRQFHKTLDQLREIQAVRADRERRDLKDAAALLEFHKHKGVPWQPADHGFVFPKDRVERFAQRLKDLNASRHIEHVLFYMPPSPRAATASH
jgi:hypothetical protein